MQTRHTDRYLYFREQIYTTSVYVMPFIEQHRKITADTSVLEIGCGEGGNLKPFLNCGCRVTGVDLDEYKITLARKFFAAHPKVGNISFICQDIYTLPETDEKYDLIILRDVIEHIPDQERFLPFMRRFLKPDGHIFFGFPPWHNPFGGHQQICRNRFISHAPYIHLLPNCLYRRCLEAAGEDVKEMMQIKQTGISLERFLRIVRRSGYRIDEQALFFINPNYEAKFELKPRPLWPAANIPYLRNFWTTCGYFLISNKPSNILP